MRLLAKVQRFKPERHPLPVMEEFGVTVNEGTTVLELLLDIKEKTDGSLTFRCSCRSAICGSCAMEINGTEKLACKTQVMKEIAVHGGLVIKPLKGTNVIKDLVVDMKPFWDDIRRVRPWLVQSADSGKFTGNPAQEKNFNDSDNCIDCGSCVSVCTSREVSPGFAGPAALAKAYRFLADPRDGGTKDRLAELEKEDGIWDCARCYYCMEVCPKDVKPVEAIVRSRKKAIEEGFDGEMGARHITEFMNSVYKEGLVNETALPVAMIGPDPGELLAKLPLGIKMLVRGKMMSPFKKPVEGIKEIREIFDKYRSEEE